MFRLVTIEREYGCGGGAIAAQLAEHLGWKLWDKRLTEEIAHMAHVDSSAVRRCDEKMDGSLYRLAKAFWRGSYRRGAALGNQAFDTDCMMEMMQEITAKIEKEGNAVVVGRGSPFFLRENPEAFHVFLYAPRAERSGVASPMACRGAMRKIRLTPSIASAPLISSIISTPTGPRVLCIT